MKWIQDWKRILKMVEALQEVTVPYFKAVEAYGSDYHGISNSSFIPKVKDIGYELQKMAQLNDLPEDLTRAIKHFSSKTSKDISGIPGAGLALCELAILKSVFEFHTHDPELIYKTQAERAFLHLNRSLMVDDDFRLKWSKAFSKGETEIEKLGALHLLSHGLWAFKSHSTGERTDLIIQQNVNLEDVVKSMTSLVLTEWKKVEDKDVNEKVQQAIKQLKAYSSGSLATMELSSTCYAVIVSDKHQTMPADIEEKNRIYRHVNIVINPDVPSKR